MLLGEIGQGVVQAARLLFSLDPGLYQIIGLSLAVSGGAVLTAALVAIPLGALLALRPFPGSKALAVLADALMGLPPVVVGLLVYLFFARSGPLGVLDLLYTPTAMMIAQFLLVLPIITALVRAAVAARDRRVRETAQTLGASPAQAALSVVVEARGALVGAVLAGFGRALAEVGAVMLVGGNLEGRTRVMTTAIVLETGKGNFDTAIALGLVLILLAITVTALLRRFTSPWEEAGA